MVVVLLLLSFLLILGVFFLYNLLIRFIKKLLKKVKVSEETWDIRFSSLFIVFFYLVFVIVCLRRNIFRLGQNIDVYFIYSQIESNINILHDIFMFLFVNKYICYSF